MKKIILLAFLLFIKQMFAIVSDGKKQEVSILKENEQTVYVVHNKKFKSLEDCAKFCYQVSAKPKSV